MLLVSVTLVGLLVVSNTDFGRATVTRLGEGVDAAGDAEPRVDTGTGVTARVAYELRDVDCHDGGNSFGVPTGAPALAVEVRDASAPAADPAALPGLDAGTDFRGALSPIESVVSAAQVLTPEVWARRHRGIVWLLWLHVGGVAVFAVARGKGLAHAVAEVSQIRSNRRMGPIAPSSSRYYTAGCRRR